MEDATRERYYALRQKLAGLNYPTSFGMDSIDLVEKLVVDLVHTTDSYRQVQANEKSLVNDLSQTQVYTARNDISIRVDISHHVLLSVSLFASYLLCPRFPDTPTVGSAVSSEERKRETRP